MIVTNNIIAMNAQRQFNIVGTSKKKSTEKLSSGYKINRAADDAAGLSISEKMRKQIRSLNQGADNIQEGISLCNIADGALTEIHDMLHRENELLIQAANGTNSDSDRRAIQDEIDALSGELDRIFDSTKFNEINIFKGKSVTTSITKEKNVTLEDLEWFPIGTTPTNTDSVKYVPLDTNSKLYKDLITVNPPSTGKFTNVAGNIDLASYNDFFLVWDSGNKAIAYESDDTMPEYIDATKYLKSHIENDNSVIDKYEISGVEFTKKIIGDGKSYQFIYEVTNKSYGENEYFTLDTTIGIVDKTNFNKYGYVTYSAPGTDVEDIPARFQPEFINPTADFYLDKGETGILSIYTSEIKLTKIPYIKENIEKSSTNSANVTDVIIQTNDNSNRDKQIPIKLFNLSADSLKLQPGRDISAFDFDKSLENVSNGIATISAIRSYYGAITNRLEHAYNNNKNIEENTQAAESRIRDTDMAKEMVNNTKLNILEQAVTSMMAQANQSNQGVLSLLQ